MSATDDAVSHAERYAETFTAPGLPATPATGLAVVTCMDARVDPAALLGLRPGDAHVIRNAGGAITQEEIRSLAVSQRLLGTTEIVVILHTDCGMRTFLDAEFRAGLQAETGLRPAWTPLSFGDLDDDVRRFVGLLVDHPFLARTKSVRGFVYDVATGRLREVR